MHQFVSETCQYGDLTRGPRIINEETRARMREALKEIQSGQFAREFIAEYENGNPNYHAMKQRDLSHPIEQVGVSLRARMPWLTP
jgi:ketol-acid reductoisomerase